MISSAFAEAATAVAAAATVNFSASAAAFELELCSLSAMLACAPRSSMASVAAPSIKFAPSVSLAPSRFGEPDSSWLLIIFSAALPTVG